MLDVLPEAVPFDTYTVPEMFDHLAKHHQIWPLTKTRKDMLVQYHTQYHTEPHHSDHIHTAVTVVGGTLTAVVANPINSNSRRALKELVDNDFKALQAEMEQTAADIRQERLADVRAKWADRQKTAKAFQRRAQLAVDRYRESYRTLEQDAKIKDLLLTMPGLGSYHNEVSAVSKGLKTALYEANQEVDREVARAMLTLERERLRAQRQVLLAGVTQEALDLLGTIPTAQQLMMDAAAAANRPPQEMIAASRGAVVVPIEDEDDED